MFISHLVPVSDWNVTAECKMKLNESYECSKELKVILFSKFNFNWMQYNAKKINKCSHN